MKGIFCGAKRLAIGESSPFVRVEFVPEGTGKLEHQEFVSKKGKDCDIQSIGGVEELGAPVELFPALSKLAIGSVCDFQLEPDPANFQRVRIASVA